MLGNKLTAGPPVEEEESAAATAAAAFDRRPRGQCNTIQTGSECKTTRKCASIEQFFYSLFFFFWSSLREYPPTPSPILHRGWRWTIRGTTDPWPLTSDVGPTPPPPPRCFRDNYNNEHYNTNIYINIYMCKWIYTNFLGTFSWNTF